LALGYNLILVADEVNL